MERNQTGDPEEVARRFDVIAKEAAQEKPLKDVLAAAGAGLIDAAKAITDRVEPVVQAVGRVLKFFGIAALL